MGFADWKGKKQQAATATVATLATVEPKKALKNDNPTLCVADVASVAVAVSENKQKSELVRKYIKIIFHNRLNSKTANLTKLINMQRKEPSSLSCR